MCCSGDEGFECLALHLERLHGFGVALVGGPFAPFVRAYPRIAGAVHGAEAAREDCDLACPDDEGSGDVGGVMAGAPGGASIRRTESRGDRSSGEAAARTAEVGDSAIHCPDP